MDRPGKKTQQQDPPEHALLLPQEVCTKSTFLEVQTVLGRKESDSSAILPEMKSTETKHPRKKTSLRAAATTGLRSWWGEKLPTASEGRETAREQHPPCSSLLTLHPRAFIRDRWSCKPRGGLGHPRGQQQEPKVTQGGARSRVAWYKVPGRMVESHRSGAQQLGRAARTAYR